jgi:hypothetical protein
MALSDLPLEALQVYRPDRFEPDDFDAFWTATLENARGYDLNPVFSRVRSALSLIDVWDASYSGYGGQPIKAWLATPAGASGQLPASLSTPDTEAAGVFHTICCYTQPPATLTCSSTCGVRGAGGGREIHPTPRAAAHSTQDS